MSALKTSVSHPEVLTRLIAELTSYSTLTANWDWDNKGAIAPSPEAVKAALKFMAAYPADYRLPKTCISPFGHLMLYWNTEDVHAHLEFFEGEISLSLFWENEGKDTEIEDLWIDSVKEEMTTAWIEDKMRCFKA